MLTFCVCVCVHLSDRLEKELDLILAQQKDIEELLRPLEEQASYRQSSTQQKADVERERMSVVIWLCFAQYCYSYVNVMYVDTVWLKVWISRCSRWNNRWQRLLNTSIVPVVKEILMHL